MPPTDILRLAAEVFAGGVFFVVVSALLFWPLEELFESDKPVRATLKDLAYLWFYQSYGLWIGAGIVFEIAYLLRGLLPDSWVNFVHSTPFWVQAVAAFVMAEIWVYLAHRLSHKSDFLWQFHKVHHTVLDMSWSAASRAHPVDFFLTIVGANLPALALGIDLTPIALFVVLERFYTVLLHANLRLDWGWFSRIIASPSLHREHHMPRGNRSNYAGILSLLDWLGGTYRPPGPKPVRSSTAPEEVGATLSS